MELRVRHIARNVLFNWFGTIANMAVGFFLAPFILHRLGNVAYGIWVLAISVVAYLGLLDLGMQSSVLRFVSKGHTKQDHQGASEALSAALWVRLQISALVLLLSAGIAAVFPYAFKVPPEFSSAARIATLLIGVNAAISMSVGVVGGVLSALNRYDLQNYVSMVQTAVRVVGVVAVLRSGHGIVAIALCELVATLIGNLLLVWIARRLYPELQIQLKRPKRETLKQIWAYSSYAFLTTVAVRLVYQTDNLVVGAFVSTSAVTFYAIANSLCRYADQIVNAMGATFVPAASTYEAAGDASSLLILYKNGTRAILAISLPILITLIVRGPSFIGLWMGPEYAKSSGPVLIILSIALLFSFANRTASSIAFGIEKHKTAAIWSIGEGVANLTLSIVLVHWYGIIGVALGTMVPSLLVHLVLWPSYISNLVNLSYSEVVYKVWTPVFLSSIPFAMATYAVNVFFPAHSLVVFFAQVIALLPVFIISVGLVFRTYVSNQLVPRIRSRFSVEAKI
ncbi:MAG: oligosaccharide flippase family protein [Acidobacteriaceae bacterium]|nr:oligosaccharide flippase family protein [Acidobacteriaceae bacterium]